MKVVQLIKVQWTKNSRGGKAAATRNAVPNAFPLLSCEGRAVCCFQTVSCEEASDFRPASRIEKTVDQLPVTWRCLRLTQDDGSLRVEFKWSAYECGAPERRDSRIFSMAPGDWCRLICNGRYSLSDGSWHYQQSTYNIAVGDGFPPDIFITTEPHREVRMLAALR